MTTVQFAWAYLIFAGVFEVAFAIALKYSHGFTRLWPSVFVFAGGFVSLWLLAQAVKTLPIGTAYAVWTGIGAVGTALVGALFLSEPHHALRLLSILLIVAGITGLRLSS